MKILRLMIGIFILKGVSTPSFSQDTIHWQAEYNLKWSDFQGTADSSSQFGAISYCGIKYSLVINEDGFKAKVVCLFNKNISWVRIRSKMGLTHEQGHFNIAELFSRKLRKKFAEYKFNYTTIRDDFENIFLAIKKERASMDSLYDKETDFSRNEVNQERWSKKIMFELSKLTAYSN